MLEEMGAQQGRAGFSARGGSLGINGHKICQVDLIAMSQPWGRQPSTEPSTQRLLCKPGQFFLSPQRGAADSLLTGKQASFLPYKHVVQHNPKSAYWVISHPS